jgi:SAM-dependent methyltransferase
MRDPNRAAVPPSELYREDLAYIHHVGFGSFSESASSGLLDLLRAAGIASGPVVDLGCGSGIWLRELNRAGYEGIGVDTSPAILALAQKTAPRAKLYARSAYEFDFPPCEAVTAIGEVLTYLPPGGARPPSLGPLFKRIAAALRPGGLFIFDVILRSGRRPMRYRTWEAGEDWAVLADVSEEPARRRVERRILTFRRVGETFRRSEERHRVRLFSRAQLERQLRAAGLTVRTSRRYGALELPSRRLAFVARRARD